MAAQSTVLSSFFFYLFVFRFFVLLLVVSETHDTCLKMKRKEEKRNC